MSADQEHPEIRPDLRYQARVRIYYGPFPGELFLSDYSIDISSGGVFVETTKILPENTVLTVKFNLPDSDAVIYSHARVAWVNHPDNIKKSSLPPGMGIQFITLNNPYPIQDFLNKGNFVPSW